MENGWILDDGLLCVGLGCGGFDMVCYTDPRAIRMVGKQDAENLAFCLDRAGLGYLSRRVKPVEHGWG